MNKNEYTFKIQLTAGDFRTLSNMAGRWNMTTGELLETFIKDLTDSKERSGSDEAINAAAWYDRARCNYEADHNSFLTWLINNPAEMVIYSYASPEARYYKNLPQDSKTTADKKEERDAAEQLAKIWAAYYENTDRIEDQREAFLNADRWTQDRTFLEAEAKVIKE